MLLALLPQLLTGVHGPSIYKAQLQFCLGLSAVPYFVVFGVFFVVVHFIGFSKVPRLWSTSLVSV